MGLSKSKLDEIANRKRATGSGRNHPLFARVPAQRQSPLDKVPITGDIEKDDKSDAKSIFSSLKTASDAINANMDQGFWCTLVFISSSQRNAFLDKMGWEPLLDSETGVYVDGVAAAEQLNVVLPKATYKLIEDRPAHRLIDEVGIMPTKHKRGGDRT